MAIFMDRLISGKKCTLFHFPEDPAGMIRDYCFVEDIKDANVRALEKGSGQAFNIGTGVVTKTLGLFNKVFDAMRERITLPSELAEMERKEARPGDLKRSCLKVEKAERELGWKAGYSLEQGLRKTLEWRLTI